MQDRKKILEKLIHFDAPLKEMTVALAPFGLSSQGELVTITLKDILSVLNRFLQLELTAQDISDWAEILEPREDIEFGREGVDDEAVQEIIFKLATPELEGVLNVQRAKALVKLLSVTKVPSVEDVHSAYV